MKSLLISIISLAFLASCAPPSAYTPPDTNSTQTFSRDLNASYDQVWASVTTVAGATFFSIKNFDKGSGLMTLDYSNLKSPGPYIDCGTVQGGFSLTKFSDIPPNSPLNHLNARSMTLSGTGNITIRSLGPRRTQIQINSLYRLTVIGIQDGTPLTIGAWSFTTREPDSTVVPVDFVRRSIICKPSFKLEEEFLTEVSARL